MGSWAHERIETGPAETVAVAAAAGAGSGCHPLDGVPLGDSGCGRAADDRATLHSGTVDSGYHSARQSGNGSAAQTGAETRAHTRARAGPGARTHPAVHQGNLSPLPGTSVLETSVLETGAAVRARDLYKSVGLHPPQIERSAIIDTIRKAGMTPDQYMDMKSPQDANTPQCQSCGEYSESVKVCPQRPEDTRYLCWSCRKALILVAMVLGPDAQVYKKLRKSEQEDLHKIMCAKCGERIYAGERINSKSGEHMVCPK